MNVHNTNRVTGAWGRKGTFPVAASGGTGCILPPNFSTVPSIDAAFALMRLVRLGGDVGEFPYVVWIACIRYRTYE